MTGLGRPRGSTRTRRMAGALPLFRQWLSRLVEKECEQLLDRLIQGREITQKRGIATH